MDVTVYLPTILAISAVFLIAPRDKLGSFETIYYMICIPLGLADIALAAITYKALKTSGVYSVRVPLALVLAGLSLTHRLYSYKHAPTFFSTVIGAVATVLVYTYLNITSYVLLASVFLVVTGIVYSIISYVFAVLDFVTRVLDLLPFRLIVSGFALVVAISIAAGYPLPPT